MTTMTAGIETEFDSVGNKIEKEVDSLGHEVEKVCGQVQRMFQKKLSKDLDRNSVQLNRLKSQDGKFNIALIKQMFDDYWNGDWDLVADIVSDDIDVNVFSSIAPGGYNIKGKNNFMHFIKDKFPEQRIFNAPPTVRDFGVNEKGDVVFYHMEYDVTWDAGPYKGKRFRTTANMRDKIKDGKIIRRNWIMNIPEGKHGLDIDLTNPDNTLTTVGTGNAVKGSGDADYATVDMDTQTNEALGKKNLQLVKSLYTQVWDGGSVRNHMDPIQEYLQHCHPLYEGHYFSGIVPGGANIKGVWNLGDWMTSWDDAFVTDSMHAHDFGVSENGEVVYFIVHWHVTFKTGPYAGQHWDTTATVRKHMLDGNLRLQHFNTTKINLKNKSFFVKCCL